ncbi:MAG TPA: glycosyltransferase family 39 protein [Planctomycetota bacterium]|nr:glycosyltransferase family 39 protein [Planctomycetota bacterium]
MKTLVAALALVVLSLALRLPHGDLAEWKGDESIQFFHARRIAREHVLPARGLPTTDGPRLPIHFLYVLSVPLFFQDDPEAIRVWIALLSTVAVVSVFLLGKRDLGARPALACALLLACLPDAVRRGRWSWNPNLIPPLAVLALLLLVRANRAPKGRAGGMLVFASALLPLVHYSLIGVAGLTFVFGVLATKNRRALLLGGTLGFLLAVPHLAIEAKSGFEATRGAFAIAKESKDDKERRPLAFPELAIEALAIESYARAARSEPGSFEPYVSLLVQGLLYAGLVLGALDLYRAARERRRPKAPGIALAMAVSAWLPFLLLRLPARPHYAPAAVPALAYLAGYAATRLRLGLLLLPIGVASVLSVRSVLLAVSLGAFAPGSDYDVPFREKARVCDEILEGELELGSWPRFEYVILLEARARNLPPEKRARFEPWPSDIARYWDVVVTIPHPMEPRGRYAIAVEGGKTVLEKVP